MKLVAGHKVSLKERAIWVVLVAAMAVVPVLIVAGRRLVPQNLRSGMPSQGETTIHEKGAGKPGGGKICFVRNGWIYIKDLATQKEQKLVEGLGPNISPGGESLVFLSVTEKDDVMTRVSLPPGRFRLFSLRTMTTRVYDDLRGLRVSSGVWASDGKLAITTFDKDRDQLSIAILNPNTGDLQKKISEGWDPLTESESIYLDSWVPGNHGVIFHTLTALYEADFETGRVQKLNVGDLFKKGQISSSTKFSWSADRRYLLFDMIIDTAEEQQTGIISLYDFTTNTTRRLTPKNVQARSPAWANDEVLFTKVDYVDDAMVFSLCKINIDGTGLTTLVKNADQGSYASE